MCDPVSLAITAASTLAQSHFQNQGVKKVNSATRAAQDKFNQDVQERRNIANTSLQDSIQQTGVDQDKARLEKAIVERTAAGQPSFNQRVLLPGQGDSTGAVKTAIVQSQDKTIDRNKTATENNARLQAYGDSSLGRDIALGQNLNRINTQAGFVQGGLNNLQADSAAAAHAGDGKMAIADMIGGIGQLAGAAAGAYGNTASGAAPGYDITTGINWNTARQGVVPVAAQPSKLSFYLPGRI